MSQKEKPTYCSNLTPKSTKIFTYKGENYNVDFNLMKRSCKYFYDHRSEIKNKEKFEIEENIDLPPETIQTFLNCCQNRPTQINDIFGINYLSIKYQNEDLVKFTQNYIENNYTELIFQSIYFKQQIQDSNDIQHTNQGNEFDTTNEERIISMHFLEYIDDEKIFSLSINVLDRVLKKFFSENKDICNNPTTKKKISNFLLNCLRKYKRDASVLFVNVGFDKFDRDLIISLHNEFSDIFDFNMIDSKSLFETTYELISEISQIRSLLKIISDQQTSQKNEFNDYKLKLEQEMNQRDQNQNQLSLKIQSVEENQSNAFVRIQTIENKNSEIEKKLQILDENKETANKIQNLENKNSENERKIQSLDEKQRNNSDKIQTLENKKNDFENRIQDLDSKNSNLTGRLQTLESKQRTNESELSQQKQNQQSVQSSLNDISSKISKLATREIFIKFFYQIPNRILCNFFFYFGFIEFL